MSPDAGREARSDSLRADVGSSLGFVLKAAAFASERHRAQRRKDQAASPYINHPLALAALLANEGRVSDEITLAAALLHDTLEDTQTSFTELVAEFGEPVAKVVEEVTDDKTLPKALRKKLQIEHASRISDRAKLVKLADKICNLRDVHSSPPVDWPVERRREYFDWAKAVVDNLRGAHAGLELLFDDVFQRRP
ncbi:MAG: bifunctional (p)ppGpp synthetase/guanosine-3',5'-bis(diphosphate) 3'-pyrophosphohydrolase [Deltaproteobacteria bacterium]|nr:bifunctional (p)ppGpp synthetase/guanosine-3',5'-bis(diphosphate) 3'-pyrophosphohydrolase [Deltaproteobacteria bacterium]